MSATYFEYYNDPTSAAGGPLNFVIEDDTITYTDLAAINNDLAAKPDISLYVPFAWARLATENGVPNPDPNANGEHIDIPLTWDNCRGGWYTEDFNGTGTSLLVTLDIVTRPTNITPDEQIAAGKVADGPSLTMVNVLASADVVQQDPEGAALPPERLTLHDRVPIADLGSFGPGETKNFELALTYHWGDGPHPDGALRTSGYFFTIVPVDGQDAHLDYMV
jgi:hypothetical protein